MNSGNIIAIYALALTFYGLYATRRHNRLSVTPHICSCRSRLATNGGVTFAYDISNNGIGPARITSFVLLRDGKPFPRGKGEYVEALFSDIIGDKLKCQFSRSLSLGENTSMRAGDTARLVEIFIPGATPADELKFQELLSTAHIRIEYESFYGKRFAYDSRD